MAVVYMLPILMQALRDLHGLQILSPAVLYGMGAIAACVAGTLVASAKLPERCAPGAFDYVGHSHQWLNLSWVVSNALEYGFLLDLFTRTAGTLHTLA